LGHHVYTLVSEWRRRDIQRQSVPQPGSGDRKNSTEKPWLAMFNVMASRLLLLLLAIAYDGLLRAALSWGLQEAQCSTLKNKHNGRVLDKPVASVSSSDWVWH